MSGKYPALGILLIALLFASCKKNDPGSGTTATEMKDMQIAPGFSWETSRDVTFQIYSDHSTVIDISSETADIRYYRGYFNGLTSNFTVKVTIPALVRQVRVNGTRVPLSGSIVPVNLSNPLKSNADDRPQGIPSLGLMAAWHFDENSGTTALDSAGGHNGLISSAGWASGIRGSALAYNGSTSYVKVPNAGLDLVTNGISFSFWFRLNAVGDNGTIVFQNLKYSVALDSQGRIVFALYTPAVKSVNSGTSNRVLDTDWHHVVVTYDGTIMKIVLDGLLRTYIANSGNLQSSSADIYIGKQQTSSPFKGTIDEMLIYNRALTDNEIAQIYGSTPNPGTGSDDLVTWWKLDENAGNIVTDSKGINNGTITGATWTPGISGSCLTFDGTTGVAKAPSKLNLNPV